MERVVYREPGFLLEIEPQPGYLRASVSEGQDSPAVSLAYWTLLGDECRRSGARKMLVIEDLEPCEVTDAEFEALFEEMVGMGFRNVTVAFVPLRASLQTNERGSLLGVEFGLDLISTAPSVTYEVTTEDTCCYVNCAVDGRPFVWEGERLKAAARPAEASWLSSDAARPLLARLSDEEDMRWIEGMLARAFG